MAKLLTLAFTLLATLASATPLDARNGGDSHDGPSCPSRPPRDGKCWKDILGLQWTVHGFDFHSTYTFTTPAHQNSWGYVNFNLTNNVVPYTAVCSAASSQLTDFFFGTVDYNCTLPSNAPAGAAVKFRFSRPSGQLDISESIICSEKQATYGSLPLPAHPDHTANRLMSCESKQRNICCFGRNRAGTYVHRHDDCHSRLDAGSNL